MTEEYQALQKEFQAIYSALLMERDPNGVGYAAQAAKLQAENEQLRAALKELVKAADPRTNMSDIPLLDALSVARAALARAEGGE